MSRENYVFILCHAAYKIEIYEFHFLSDSFRIISSSSSTEAISRALSRLALGGYPIECAVNASNNYHIMHEITIILN